MLSREKYRVEDTEAEEIHIADESYFAQCQQYHSLPANIQSIACAMIHAPIHRLRRMCEKFDLVSAGTRIQLIIRFLLAL